MRKFKGFTFIEFLMVIVLSLFVFSTIASARTPSTLRPNDWRDVQRFHQGVDVRGGDLSVKDKSGVSEFFKVDTDDGSAEINNSAGTQVWGIDTTGTNEAALGYATARVGSNYSADVGWSADSSGNSGYHLSSANLIAYNVFYIGTSGGSVYSHACPAGTASSGETVYIPDPAAEYHKKIFEFVNEGGTTAFVIYNANGRFDAGSGTTTGYSWGTTDTACEDKGDTVRLQCIHTPSAVSGWYVMDINKRD